MMLMLIVAIIEYLPWSRHSCLSPPLELILYLLFLSLFNEEETGM